MNIDKAVLALAGTITLLGVLLATLFSPWWLLLSAFAGLNQLQASVTGYCPAASVFARLGLRTGCAFDTRAPVGSSREGTERSVNGPGSKDPSGDSLGPCSASGAAPRMYT